MAGKFKYRLAQVLTLREKKEDNTKRDKAAAERERDRERDALDELQARFTAAKRAIGSSLAQGQTANVQMGNDYASALEKKIAEQEKKLKAAAEKLAAMEKALTLATRDVRILERHREKHKERWWAEENRLDAIRLDEMGTQGYLKRQNRDREDEAEEAERQAKLAAAEAALLESPWIAGLMDTAAAEAQRREGERKRDERRWRPQV